MTRESESMTLRLPVGVQPERLWIEQHPNALPEELLERLTDLHDAMTRYEDARIPVPIAWTNEALALVRRLLVLKTRGEA